MKIIAGWIEVDIWAVFLLRFYQYIRNYGLVELGVVFTFNVIEKFLIKLWKIGFGGFVNMVKERLLVSDLMNYFYDEVVLYVCYENDYKDIFKGKATDIPREMQSYEVRTIGAKRKGVLDISVKQTES